MGFLESGAEAKVRELHVTSGIQQQVVRLDISATFQFFHYRIHPLLIYTKNLCCDVMDSGPVGSVLVTFLTGLIPNTVIFLDPGRFCLRGLLTYKFCLILFF